MIVGFIRAAKRLKTSGGSSRDRGGGGGGGVHAHSQETEDS